MGRVAKMLGVVEIGRLPTPQGNPARVAVGQQLYIVLEPTGARRWEARVNGAFYGLGSVDTGRWGASLDRARATVRAMLDAARRGENPKTARDRYQAECGETPISASRVTVADALGQYLAIARREWGNPSYAASSEKRLREYLRPLMARPVNLVTAADVVEAFRPYWHTKPSTSLVTRMHIERLFAMALDIDAPNPASLKALTDKLGRTSIEARQHPALPYQDLPALMTRLAGIDTPASLALRFAILTASRTQEARDVTWREIDLERKLWTVPRAAGRVKHRPRRANGKVQRVAPHVVSLSAHAIAILDQCTRGEPDDRVFGALGPGALYRLLVRRLGLAGKASVHGFRASWKTWCAESGIPNDVSEKALSHVDGDPYNRSDLIDMRSGAMQRWGYYLEMNG